MVERWSSKSHTWVRFLLLLLAFFKKKKNIYRFLTQKSIFNQFLTVIRLEKNVKCANDVLFIKKKNIKINDYKIKIFSQENNIINFYIIFLQKECNFIFNFYYKNFEKKYLFFWQNIYNIRNTFKFNNFFYKFMGFSYFYNFFFINNFLHLLNFFKINKLEEKNKNTPFFMNFKSFSFFKNKYRAGSVFKNFKNSPYRNNRQVLRFQIFKKRNFFSYNLQFNFFFNSKFLILRKLENSVVVFYILLSKIMFNDNLFNNSFFKKLRTVAFQITLEEVLSLNLLRITKSSPKIDKYEFFKSYPLLNNFEFTNKIIIFKNLYLNNYYNYSNNFFLNPNTTPITSHLLKLKIGYDSKIFKLNIFKQFSIKQLLINKRDFFFQIQSFSDFFENNKNYSHSSFFITNDSIFNFSTKSLSSFPLYFNFFENRNFINTFFILFFKPLLLKNFFKFQSYSITNLSNLNFFFFLLKKNFKSFFYSNINTLFKTNLFPNFTFFFVLKKKILKLFSYDKFSPITTPFYIDSLIRFFEYCSGKKILLKLNMFLNRSLSYQERAQCATWAPRIKVFRKMLGPRLFLTESLEILYLSFKLKDPFFLSNWLLNMMKKISFWKYRLFFRYLKYTLRYFFTPIFKDLKVKGIKFKLKGKISVAGNARTRTILQRTGISGHASFNNKIVQQLSLVKTFTGVMGLKVWIFF